MIEFCLLSVETHPHTHKYTRMEGCETFGLIFNLYLADITYDSLTLSIDLDIVDIVECTTRC